MGSRDQVLDLLGRGQQGHHASTLRQGLHEAASGDHQLHGIVEAKHTGQLGSHDLAHAVTHEQVGLEAPARPQLGQGIANHKHSRLGEAGLAELGGGLLLVAFWGKQHAGQRCLEQRVEQGGAALKRLAKHRVVRMQPLGHAQGLGALPRQQPGQLAGPARRLPNHRTSQTHAWAAPSHNPRARHVGLELGQQGRTVGAEAHQAAHKVAAAHVGRGAEVGQGQVGLGLEQGSHTGGLLAQGLLGAGREGEHVEGHALPIARRWRRLGGIGQHHMGVGAAKPKRTHPHHRWLVGAREGLELRLNLQLEPGEINRGVGAAEIEAGGKLAVLHAQRRLDQAGDAGGGLGVPQVGLDRPHPAGLLVGAALTQHGAKGPQLDRIPLAGTGAVGLHVLGGRRVNARPLKSVPHAGHLGPQVGRHHAVGAAIGIDGRAMDQGHDRIAIGLGSRQRLEQHRPGPLAAHVAIGGGVKTLAATIGRQQTRLAEAALDTRVDQGLNAAGQGGRALAAPNALAGQVHRHQRAAAGRVHREAGALEIKEIGEPVGGNAAGVARQHKGLVVGDAVVLRRSPQQRAVVRAGDAHEHAHPLAADHLQRLAAIFKGLPGHLKEQALLGVHAHRLPRRDAKKGRIKLVDAIHKTAAAHVLMQRHRGIGIEMGGEVPALGRHLTDRRAPFAQQGPERPR